MYCLACILALPLLYYIYYSNVIVLKYCSTLLLAVALPCALLPLVSLCSSVCALGLCPAVACSEFFFAKPCIASHCCHCAGVGCDLH